MLRQQSQKLHFVGAAMLLFPQYNTTWLTAISSHCLAALTAKEACVQQSHVAKSLLP